MHDEMIERRLRTALHDEAASLGFTITAAELERRAALRRRSFAGRRLTLLLAAAVGIGLVGVGGALSGIFEEPEPSPTLPVAIVESNAPPSESPLPSRPATLPSLDDLAAVYPGGVVIAQAHDPIRPPGVTITTGLPAPVVDLGALDSATSTDYLLTAACLDSAALRFDISPPSPDAPSGAVIQCDGVTHDVSIRVSSPQHLSLAADEGARWRLVVHGPRQDATSEPDVPLQPEGTEEELVRVQGEVVDTEIPWGNSGLFLKEVTGLLGRTDYRVQISCPEGTPFRLLFGDRLDLDEFDADTDGQLYIASETHIACGSAPRDIRFSIPEQLGYHIYAAAPLGTRFDMLVSSEPPPVQLLRDAPGWTLSSGLGPNLSFDGTGNAFTGPGVDGGGRVLIAMSCTGAEPIKVTVEVGPKIGDRQESFAATCTPDGATTSQSFEIAGSYVDVSYDSAPLAWTALSILIPEGASLP